MLLIDIFVEVFLSVLLERLLRQRAPVDVNKLAVSMDTRQISWRGPVPDCTCIMIPVRHCIFIKQVHRRMTYAHILSAIKFCSLIQLLRLSFAPVLERTNQITLVHIKYSTDYRSTDFRKYFTCNIFLNQSIFAFWNSHESRLRTNRSMSQID